MAINENEGEGGGGDGSGGWWQGTARAGSMQQ